MTLLIEDGRLQIPLYHGTANLFLDSIISSGLGGRTEPVFTLIESMEPYPVLVELRDCPISSLRGERSEPVAQIIDMMQHGINEIGIERMTEGSFQTLNFELIHTISTEALRYYRIGRLNDDYWHPKYRLEEISSVGPL